MTPVEILDILKGKPEEAPVEERHEEVRERRERPPRYGERGRYDRGGRERRERRPGPPRERTQGTEFEFEDKERGQEFEEPAKPVEALAPPPPMAPEAQEKVKQEYQSINGTLEAKIFDSEWKEVAKMPVNELVSKIGDAQGSKYLVFDGIVTQRLIDSASKVGIESIVGHRTGELSNKPENISIYSFKDLGLE